MRIGLYGGSFDPVHLGHLWIAESARDYLQLDEVRWIPAAQSPLKESAPKASCEQRLTMLHLALSGAEGHCVDDRELRRGDVSYTVQTLQEICKGRIPTSTFIFGKRFSRFNASVVHARENNGSRDLGSCASRW